MVVVGFRQLLLFGRLALLPKPEDLLHHRRFRYCSLQSPSAFVGAVAAVGVEAMEIAAVADPFVGRETAWRDRMTWVESRRRMVSPILRMVGATAVEVEEMVTPVLPDELVSTITPPADSSPIRKKKHRKTNTPPSME